MFGPAHSAVDITAHETDTTSETHAQPRNRKKLCIRISLLLILILVVTLVVIFNAEVVEGLQSFLEWVQGAGALGPFVFAGVYVVATVAFLPGLLLTLGSGVVFSLAFGQLAGVFIASISVIVGASIGAIIAFLLGRYVFRETVAGYAQKHARFAALDKVIEDEGLKMTFLLRLSPVIPFNAFNYFMGVTSVRFRDYAIALAGIIPGTIVYCFIGSTLGSIADASSGGLATGGTLTLVFIIVGSALALAVTVYVSVIAKRAINRAIARKERQEEEEDERRMRGGSSDGGDGAAYTVAAATTYGDRSVELRQTNQLF